MLDVKDIPAKLIFNKLTRSLLHQCSSSSSNSIIVHESLFFKMVRKIMPNLRMNIEKGKLSDKAFANNSGL